MIEGDLSVYDQKVREYNKSLPLFKEKVGNKDGDTGYIFPILMCSEKFFRQW